MIYLAIFSIIHRIINRVFMCINIRGQFWLSGTKNNPWEAIKKELIIPNEFTSIIFQLNRVHSLWVRKLNSLFITKFWSLY